MPFAFPDARFGKQTHAHFKFIRQNNSHNDIQIKLVEQRIQTALHLTALFCRTRTVKLLLDSGADTTVTNTRGDTALDIMTAPWTPELEGVYRYLGGILQLQPDMGRLKATRPKIAAILRANKDHSEDAPR